MNALHELTLVTVTVMEGQQFAVEDRELDLSRASVLTVTVIGSGENVSFNKTRKVLLNRYNTLTFIQTDKAVYKPGQAVRFRIVTLDENFIPVHEKYPLVTMWDPQRNRIGQWKDVEPRQGIVDLTFDLMPEPFKGSYRIQVKKSQENVHHVFSVREYVLPTYELKVELPELITIVDPTIHVKVCGRYTYGKPVRGHVNGTLCLLSGYYSADSDYCQQVFGETDSNGCLSKDLSTAIFHLGNTRYNRGIQAQFVLKEEGTDLKIFKTASCNVISEVTQITFEQVEEYFRKGMPYTGQLRMKYSTGGPVTNATIYLFNSMRPGAQKVITDQNGIARFSFDTSTWDAVPIFFKAIYQISHEDYSYRNRLPHHESAQHQAKPFYSQSNSFLSIRKHRQELLCDTELEVKVDYIIKGLPDREKLDMDVSYLVMAKGLIVTFEKKSISVGGSEEGEFQLTLPISTDVAPAVRLLVFTVLPGGETIADIAKYEVSKCFPNKVSLQFSVPEDLPRSHLSLDLHAAAGSLCGLRVVDRSVLLLEPEKELSRNSVYSLLPVNDLSGYYYRVWEPPTQFCTTEGNVVLPYASRDLLGDVAQLLQDMGLKILSDTKYHAPVECKFQDDARYNSDMSHIPETMSMQTVSAAPSGNFGPAVREYFPETWIWDLIPVGSSGTASLPLTVPDSITEWKGSMFCTGEIGLGISDTVSFNAFKPFFVDLALPYSIIRTEGFTLKAKVFNYMTECIMVRITLLEAQGFEATSESSSRQETCVCSKDSVTFSWNLTASGLGEQNVTVRAESIASESLCGNEVVSVPVKGAVDIIRKPLLIQPEGTENELTHSSLLCPAGKVVTEKIHLEVPGDVVEGSSRAYVTVLGDIMGSAMENLDGLLRLPTGCGEQNMVKFAPNIYVQRYLEQTHQLTSEIQSKATGFLKTGYQRQLTFKHHDGSFSAFGASDSEGNTWLTAFVLKSFLHARPYIFIDDSILHQSTSFFLKYRLDSGCFASLGNLFNNAMKGGVDDHISLSAYVTSALLELAKSDPKMADEIYKEWRQKVMAKSGTVPDTGSDSASVEQDTTAVPGTVSLTIETGSFKEGVTDRALGCLQKAIETVNSTYTLALLAYTFTLAGDQDTRERLLHKLHGLAIKQGALTHWKRAEESEEEDHPGFWWKAPSAEVEMTAYVLLAHLSKPQVTNSDLDQAIPIVSWLIKQRNSYGGFASTQDTVVALHALSLYGGLTHVKDPHSSVSLTTEAGFHREFHIDASNQLLLQTQPLEAIPGDYSAQISGTSCLLLQTTLRYNTPPTQRDSVFTVSVAKLPAVLETGSWPNININVIYTGDRAVSNMVIVDVKMLSGYSADKDSYKMSLNVFNISKTEIQDGHMLLYIKPMEPNRLVQLSFHMSRNFEVENLQPAYVKVYDYYETDDSTIVEYKEPKRLEMVGAIHKEMLDEHYTDSPWKQNPE
uniref:alpha-2-macroglobulin-like isoform X2 n=1 Tax=Pristiophorus japonicus TaxID=55135 RepID=UPI00398E818E